MEKNSPDEKLSWNFISAHACLGYFVFVFGAECILEGMVI